MNYGKILSGAGDVSGSLLITFINSCSMNGLLYCLSCPCVPRSLTFVSMLVFFSISGSPRLIVELMNLVAASAF